MQLNLRTFVASLSNTCVVCRFRVESEVERTYVERLQQVCYRERLHQQQLFRWGQRDKARSMELPSCAELSSKFGYHQSAYVY